MTAPREHSRILTPPPAPVLTVGLPVYNGGNYLARALESLLTQTLRDIEIIVSDNASTDDTEAICRRFAEADARVRYVRQPVNLGAGPNYNFVFHEARSAYFKWAAHDDYLDADALARCVAALDAQPDVVVAYPLVVDISPDGRELRKYDGGTGGLAQRPADRLLWIWGSQSCGEIFGVIRSASLRRTRLIRDYTDSDRTLLAELALVGRILQESSVCFYRRRHDSQSTSAHPDRWQRAEWFNPANRNKIVLSVTRQSLHLVEAVAGSRLPLRDRASCLYQIARFMKWSLPAYKGEFQWACRRAWQLGLSWLRGRRLLPDAKHGEGAL